jgi:predicted DNA-binding protein YlxM (UPF0122 family)
MMLKVTQIEKVVDKYDGNIAAIARHFKVTRQTIYNRIKESVTLQDAIKDARESILDDAESELYKQVKDGNTTALIFFLKTQGKGRGYVERQEMTGADGGDVRVKFIDYGLNKDDTDTD